MRVIDACTSDYSKLFLYDLIKSVCDTGRDELRGSGP